MCFSTQIYDSMRLRRDREVEEQCAGSRLFGQIEDFERGGVLRLGDAGAGVINDLSQKCPKQPTA